MKDDNLYDVLDIAEYVIWKHNSIKYPISNLKLQKILYFIQAEFLVKYNKPCYRENIEAWNFGPVIPKVYYKYKVYGAGSIPYLYIDKYCKNILDKDSDDIDYIISESIKYDNVDLLYLTINQTPWKKAYKNNFNQIITNDSIKDFFK